MECDVVADMAEQATVGGKPDPLGDGVDVVHKRACFINVVVFASGDNRNCGVGEGFMGGLDNACCEDDVAEGAESDEQEIGRHGIVLFATVGAVAVAVVAVVVRHGSIPLG